MMQRMPVMMDRAVIFFIIFFLTPTFNLRHDAIYGILIFSVLMSCDPWWLAIPAPVRYVPVNTPVNIG
jgi:hypothetical protein